MVSTLLVRSSLRFYQRHPAQLFLSVLGILLGVGVVTAVLITNTSSQRAFTLSAEALTGTATHQMTGAEFGIPQTLYVSFKRRYHYPMAPVIEGYLTLQGELFTVLGVDPFADTDLRRRTGLTDPQQALSLIIPSNALVTPSNALMTPSNALMNHGNALMISKRTQRRSGLQLNTDYPADTGGTQTTVKLVGNFSTDNPAATDGLLIGDISTVQALLQKGKFIDRIDLIMTDAEAEVLSTALPQNVELVPAATRVNTMREMTRGFQINLTAMSLLALLVGAFLVHNTMTFSILRRRELFAIMRIMGITSTGIFFSIIVEALVISFVGSFLGILVGYGLAHYLIGLTTQTINDLYFVLHVQDVWFSLTLATLILFMGVLTCVFAAAASACEAAMVSPVQARMRSLVETRTQSLIPVLGLGGIAMMLFGSLLAWIPSRSLILGFAALMLLIVGFGLVIPWLVKAVTTGLHNASAHLGAVTQLAIGGIQRSISRTGLAIAALTIAVSATFGVDIMIGSFRQTVDVWLGKTLSSDIYITVPGNASRKTEGLLTAALSEDLQAIPGVAELGTSRVVNTRTNAGAIDMLILEPHSRSQGGFDFLQGNSDTIWNAFMNANGVLVSEPLSNRHQLSVGESISLLTPTEGYRKFRVEGIYYDYGSSHGRVTISRATYNRYWQDRSYASLSINLHPDVDIATVLEQIRTRIKQSTATLLVRSNQEIRDTSLIIFDRTFQVTRVLRLLTVGVAFVGIFSALLALQLEKGREFAVLRASGATRQQIASIVIIQTVFMGTLAGLLAIPLGWAMSDILIQVINQRSFGWSMDSLLPEGSLPATLWLAISSALLAGLYPAWALSRTNIASQLRDE